MKIFKRPLALSGAFLTVLGLAWTEASWGYSKLCAHIMPGAGVSGRMRTVVQYTPPVYSHHGSPETVTIYSDWTGSYPIGQTACQDIPVMYNPYIMKMEEYSVGVEFKADAFGDTIRCQQFIKDPLRRLASGQPYQYNIWGTVHGLYCSSDPIAEQWTTPPKPDNPKCPCECGQND